MKSLYESILSDQEEQTVQASKLCGDMFKIKDIYMNNDAYTDVNVARYFKWAEVKKYCQKNNLTIPDGWATKKDRVGELPAIFNAQPYIGYAQNFMIALRQFLRTGFKIQMTDKKTYNGGNNTYMIYKISKPTGDPEDTLFMNVFILAR